MIVFNDGILLESSDNIKTTSITGYAVVGHDRIEDALGLASSIRYDATSLKAVQCILNSSARNRICIPLCMCSDRAVKTATYEAYSKEFDDTDSEAKKLLSLVVNRNVVSFGSAVSSYISETKNKNRIMYLSVDNHGVNIRRQRIITKSSSMEINELVALSDELWQAGYMLLKIDNTREIVGTHIKRIHIARNGREVKMPAVDIIGPMFGVMHG